MTGVIFMTSISLDGYFEGVDRGLEWQLVDGELHAHFNSWLRDTTAFFEGRVTWELMAGFWPTADADPDASPEVRAFGPIWRHNLELAWHLSRSSECELNLLVV